LRQITSASDGEDGGEDVGGVANSLTLDFEEDVEGLDVCGERNISLVSRKRTVSSMFLFEAFGGVGERTKLSMTIISVKMFVVEVTLPVV